MYIDIVYQKFCCKHLTKSIKTFKITYFFEMSLKTTKIFANMLDLHSKSSIINALVKFAIRIFS